MTTPGYEFYVNSRECIGTPSQFQVTKQLFRRPDTVFTLTLTQVVIPNLIPTIRRGQNDTFKYEVVVSGVTFTGSIVIQEGYYSPTQMASALQTALQVVDSQFFVAWDASTSKFLLSTGVGKTIRFPLSSPVTPEQPFYFPEEILLETLGWKEWTVTPSVGDGTYKAPQAAARIAGTFTIDLISNFTTDGISTSGRTRMLARIPVTVDYGGLIIWEPQLQDSGCVLVEANHLNQFQALFLDEWGQILRLPSNAHTSLKFKLVPA